LSPPPPPPTSTLFPYTTLFRSQLGLLQGPNFPLVHFLGNLVDVAHRPADVGPQLADDLRTNRDGHFFIQGQLAQKIAGGAVPMMRFAVKEGGLGFGDVAVQPDAA